MSMDYKNEPLLDMFIFETSLLLEQLEQSILSSEKESFFSKNAINEIFRIMHTIKGSAAMMMFDNISILAHAIEDLFYYLREDKPKHIDYSILSDLVFNGVDFIKEEIEKIKNGNKEYGEAASLIHAMKEFLTQVKQDGDKTISTSKINVLKVVVFFEEGCEMENIRAYTITRNLMRITKEFFYLPEDIIDNDDSIDIIRREGFTIYLKTENTYQEMYDFFMQTIFLKDLELIQLENEDVFEQYAIKLMPQKNDITSQKEILDIPDTTDQNGTHREQFDKEMKTSGTQSIISVNVAKLDKLMNLVSEMVIAEAMVIQNRDLAGLELDNFKKAAGQLLKISSELQDTVMSIRMIPLATTFNKMHRIIRDMCKKLNKEVKLEIRGEETEVDKNIIEHISDPIMHLVRNAVDHGIESVQERISKGKPKVGTVTLEAKNNGNDVLITVSDDGRGLDTNKILEKALAHNLLIKNGKDMTDQEVFNLILLPGFSTNDNVTEFSGRGVGMDVVSKNIEVMGGSLSVNSNMNEGTIFSIKIPLTLAIIDGMNIKVGHASYTIPTISIQESFRPKGEDIIKDEDGSEMIMVRGRCYKIVRLHELYKVETNILNFAEGILIMVEHADKSICIFADELIGQQQVVVKSLPEYIRKFKTTNGISGCTLLGDGSISLILDVAGMINQ